jgi:hypothetical protein
MQFDGPLVFPERRINRANAVEDQSLAVRLVLTLPDLKGAAVALDGASIVAQAGFRRSQILQGLSFPCGRFGGAEE